LIFEGVYIYGVNIGFLFFIGLWGIYVIFFILYGGVYMVYVLFSMVIG